MPLEARLLHFSSSPVSATNKWHLSHPGRKGMPIDAATLSAEPVESLAHKKTYRVGILEAVTDVVGEGGVMEGWKVQSIGQGYKDALEAQNAVVIVVREEKKKVTVDLGHEISMMKKQGDEKDCVRTLSASKPSGAPVYTPTFSPMATMLPTLSPVSAMPPAHSPYAIGSTASPTYDPSSQEMTPREMI
ncbi:MAG: hypothetical protein LQ343_004001 [Gyalolechia ehrenbergii]|nr:MAG: hypothetical protein LQ343_004001 [Gyalolechia ehrenbergii]